MSAAESAANLTRQLLTFSRREAKQARDLDLGEVIGSVIKLLQRILGEDISLETRFAPSLPLVHADPGMIEQIIMNLAINARDAMANGGQLSVSLDSLTIDPARAAGHPHVSSGPFVCIAVGDTGCGISSENISRIFEPFFTTKDIGKGTGLGLAIVFGIVEQHHGWIEVESELDHGATFRIFLPALEREISSRAIAPAKPKPVGGQETVLLVEDETALRTVAAAVLEQYGYKVLAAPLPSAALEIWEQRRGTIDLVLVDLMMPGGISGRELAERLLADEPTLKVIYSSGYSEDIVRRQLHLDPGRNFLQKPCTSMALLHAVRRCLDEDRVRGD
jgi:CheY-like chemotaxis protein